MTDYKRFKCDFCDEDFGNRSSMEKHVRIIHKQLEFQTCDSCGKMFNSK